MDNYLQQETGSKNIWVSLRPSISIAHTKTPHPSATFRFFCCPPPNEKWTPAAEFSVRESKSGVWRGLQKLLM